MTFSEAAVASFKPDQRFCQFVDVAYLSARQQPVVGRIHRPAGVGDTGPLNETERRPPDLSHSKPRAPTRDRCLPTPRGCEHTGRKWGWGLAEAALFAAGVEQDDDDPEVRREQDAGAGATS